MLVCHPSHRCVSMRRSYSKGILLRRNLPFIFSKAASLLPIPRKEYFSDGASLSVPEPGNRFGFPNTKPDAYHLVHLIRHSTDIGLDSYCQQVHCHVVKSGLASNAFVSGALLRFYKEMGCSSSAYKVFVEIPEPSLVSWNTLISCYLRCGKFSRALGVFVLLERLGLCADAYTFTMGLSASGQLGLLTVGSALHCNVEKCGVGCGLVVANCLIDMYGKCGCVESAVQVFTEMVEKDSFSWNSVIAATARNQRLELAHSFFSLMPRPDTISYNELINGISQFGDIKDAVEILKNMPSPNSSSWNSIITGCVNRNRALEALDLFAEMHSNSIKMDVYTYSVLLSGVAGLAALTWGMLIHCFTVKCGLDLAVVIGSALVNMYSKCGHVDFAESIFHTLPNKSLVTWNAMASGYAHNGDSQKVIQLFEEMKTDKDLKPDWVTFLNLIAACSENDIFSDRAYRYFESMIHDYGISPTVEHCCSMIRLLSQRGELQRARRMIYELNFGSCPGVWRTLLGASATCKNLTMANIAAAKVIQLEGDDDYVYVSMSNILASYGRWADVTKVRKVMSKRGILKEVGRSWMEIRNTGDLISFEAKNSDL